MKPSDILDKTEYLLQLTKEAAELSHTAVKLMREIYGNNPTCRGEKELIEVPDTRAKCGGSKMKSYKCPTCGRMIYRL